MQLAGNAASEFVLSYLYLKVLRMRSTYTNVHAFKATHETSQRIVHALIRVRTTKSESFTFCERSWERLNDATVKKVFMALQMSSHGLFIESSAILA